MVHPLNSCNNIYAITREDRLIAKAHLCWKAFKERSLEESGLMENSSYAEMKIEECLLIVFVEHLPWLYNILRASKKPWLTLFLNKIGFNFAILRRFAITSELMLPTQRSFSLVHFFRFFPHNKVGSFIKFRGGCSAFFADPSLLKMKF